VVLELEDVKAFRWETEVDVDLEAAVRTRIAADVVSHLAAGLDGDPDLVDGHHHDNDQDRSDGPSPQQVSCRRPHGLPPRTTGSRYGSRSYGSPYSPPPRASFAAAAMGPRRCRAPCSAGPTARRPGRTGRRPPRCRG